MSFFEELKRRKVFRVGVAYLVLDGETFRLADHLNGDHYKGAAVNSGEAR